MKTTLLKSTLIAGLLLTASCSDDGREPDGAGPFDPDSRTEYFFHGYIRDCLTGSALTDVSLMLRYGRSSVTAEVEEDGYYHLGPLPASYDEIVDYTVIIDAEGYLPFISHNHAEPILVDELLENANEGDIQDSYTRGDLRKDEHWVGYACPNSILTGERTVRVFGGETPPSGRIRFVPQQSSSAFGLDHALEVGADNFAQDVNQQVWFNDGVFTENVVNAPLNNGEATVPSGSFIGGMTYRVLVTTNDQQYRVDDDFTIGPQDELLAFDLAANQENLAVVYRSDAVDLDDPPALVTFEVILNQAVEYPEGYHQEEALETVNENLSLSPALGGGALTTRLRAYNGNDPTARGVSIEVSGNRILIQWNQDTNPTPFLDFENDEDFYANFGGLNQIRLRSVHSPGEETSLGNLLGDDSVQVFAHKDETVDGQ